MNGEPTVHSRLDGIRYNLWMVFIGCPWHFIPNGLFQWLLQVPLLGDFIFFLNSTCPYHWCSTGRVDEWVTRRACAKCNDWWDM